jgi:hypothetical protein
VEKEEIEIEVEEIQGTMIAIEEEIEEMIGMEDSQENLDLKLMIFAIIVVEWDIGN